MQLAKRPRDKGFAVIMTTLSLVATMLVAGLGFDVGIMYLIRTKLQGAADAAALAAVRALAANGNMSAAQTVGTEFLIANFPTGYWGATALSTMPVASALTITLIQPNGSAGTAGTTATAKLVTVNIGVTAPLYFLRMLGQNMATISVTAQGKREGLLVMLVLDGSGSMWNLIAGTPAFTWAMNDAQAFLGNPQFDPDIDRVGLVVFGGNAFTVAPIANFQSPAGTVNTSSSVYTALNSYGGSGNTNTSLGLQAAYTAMQNFYGGAGASPNRANVLILMTDGAPNGFTADWTGQLQPGSTCAPPSGGRFIGCVNRNSTVIAGIFNITPGTSATTPDSTTLGVVANNGLCQMSTNAGKFWKDFTMAPSTDSYGDALTGGNTYLPGTSLTFSANFNGTSDQPTDEQQYRDLSSNAADGTATRLRTDSLLKIQIVTIALAGNSGTNIYDLLDPVLLQRMANATTSPIYDPTQPVGAYFYAQDATYLGAEFAAAASTISARLYR
jgi:hypothetical protein